MGAGEARLPDRWDRQEIYQPSAKFLRLAQLRKVRQCEQVAAVCFRIGSAGIEFLLVQTRGGRWTFPKGGAEPGLTHAQAAALEAYEEAGVHGRMEEDSFTWYLRHKRGGARNAAIAVHAHLCEVLRLAKPQEDGRSPTWFSPDKAKLRLKEDRALEYGLALTRVVDRAVARIQRLRSAVDVANVKYPKPNSAAMGARRRSSKLLRGSP